MRRKRNQPEPANQQKILSYIPPAKIAPPTNNVQLHQLALLANPPKPAPLAPQINRPRKYEYIPILSSLFAHCRFFLSGYLGDIGMSDLDLKRLIHSHGGRIVRGGGIMKTYLYKCIRLHAFSVFELEREKDS
jgi:hypothetical protein